MNDDGMPEESAMKDKKVSGSDADIIAEVKKRFTMCASADADNFKNGMDDLTFLKGDQWPEKQRRQRESEGRPCLTVNKLPTFLQQVTNDQRQNRASIKVSAVGVHSDNKTSEVIQGMIRHIEYDSSADIAYDTAVNSAAGIGFGYFRLVTEYCDPDSFDQELKFKRVRNAFTVHGDPASVEPDGSDCQFWIISEKMTKDEFKARYPKAQMTNQGFDTGVTESTSNWQWENMVRVAEYYKIEFEPATLYQMSDGSTSWDKKKTVDGAMIPEGVTMVKSRQSAKQKVMWYLVTPFEILDRVEIKCKWIPVFPVYGTEIDIDGKIYRAGLIRNAKDPAMMYNFWMTSATEEVSLRPKTPYIGVEGQFEGHEKRWAQANNRSFPYLEYKPVSVDGQLAPPPQRQAMVDIPSGVLTMATHAADNIKATTGLFDSSLGNRGNATSGKQELAQQKQGNIANFHYMDNFARTLRQAGRCLIDMIPHYYDTERLVRCRGEDGSVSAEYINKWDEAAQKIVNDLTVGEWDVAVSMGPSYATMRAEAADAMIQFGQSWPKLMDIAGDEVVKAMNWPGADDIAKRIERTIPKEIRDDPDEAAKNGQQPPIPPEVQQQIQQMQQQMQELQQMADDNKTKLEIEEKRSQTAVEVAHIASESRKDVKELEGYIKLLIAKLQPPEVLSTDIQQDLLEDENGQQRGAIPESYPPESYYQQPPEQPQQMNDPNMGLTPDTGM